LKKTFYILLILSLSLSACKSFQKTAYKETKNISTGKLLKQVRKNRFDAKSFESRVSIDYQNQNQSFSANGKIKILKDSIIWGSLNFVGIPMLKIFITPEKIQYYNKLDQTYYDGSFEILQDKLGVPVNFAGLQNLLLGDMVQDVSENEVELTNTPKYYRLNINNQYLNYINITPFYKTLETGFQDMHGNKATFFYSDYQAVDKENLPKRIQIKTSNNDVKIYYKNINLNKDLRFPFTIPNDYKRVSL